LPDPSVFAVEELARNAHERGASFRYDGYGADCLIGDFPHAYLYKLMYKNPIRGVIEFIKFIGRRPAMLSDIINASKRFSMNKPDWYLGPIVTPYFNLKTELKRAPSFEVFQKNFDLKEGGLEVALRYADRSSMMFSLERRYPYISNWNLVNFLVALPTKFKLHNGWAKFIQRKLMSQNALIPKEIIWNPNKIGLDTPREKWLNEDFYNFIVETLSDATFVHKIVNTQKLLNVKPFSLYTWRVLNVELWARTFNFECEFNIG